MQSLAKLLGAAVLALIFWAYLNQYSPATSSKVIYQAQGGTALTLGFALCVAVWVFFMWAFFSAGKKGRR